MRFMVKSSRTVIFQDFVNLLLQVSKVKLLRVNCGKDIQIEFLYTYVYS